MGESRPFSLEKAHIASNNLVFESSVGLSKALHQGFFLLKIPEALDVTCGVKLCHNFHRAKIAGQDASYTGFKKLESLYFDREHFQTEHILTDKKAREKYFPPEVVELADSMNKISILILRHVLAYIGIPPNDWVKITGGCTENKGQHWFACSHYRSDLDKQGCATHQDTGFVTVLYIDKPGLEAKIENQWQNILPFPGYFVINFGRSFEILTEKLAVPVRGVLHRVKKIVKKSESDRISMAAFTNTPTELNLYQYDSKKSLNFYQTVEDFLNEFNKATWDDKHADFGLKAEA